MFSVWLSQEQQVKQKNVHQPDELSQKDLLACQQTFIRPYVSLGTKRTDDDNESQSLFSVNILIGYVSLSWTSSSIATVKCLKFVFFYKCSQDMYLQMLHFELILSVWTQLHENTQQA